MCQSAATALYTLLPLFLDHNGPPYLVPATWIQLAISQVPTAAPEQPGKCSDPSRLWVRGQLPQGHATSILLSLAYVDLSYTKPYLPPPTPGGADLSWSCQSPENTSVENPMSSSLSPLGWFFVTGKSSQCSGIVSLQLQQRLDSSLCSPNDTPLTLYYFSGPLNQMFFCSGGPNQVAFRAYSRLCFQRSILAVSGNYTGC